MTVAFGVIASDGIVIAADSEESIPGVMKREQQKIVATCTRHGAPYTIPDGTRRVTISLDDDEPCGDNPPDTDIAITGAGTPGYIDAIVPLLIKVFTDDEWMTDHEEIRRRVEAVIRKFHREHIVPFAAYPAAERPEIEMLLAYQRAGRRRILVSEKTAVQSFTQGEIAAIGAGAFFAKTLAREFTIARPRYARKLDVRSAMLLAMYTVFRVKEFIDGCGKYTTVAILPYATPPSRAQIADLESVFSEHAYLEARTLEAIFRHPSATPVDAEAFSAKYDALRHKCDQIVTPTARPELPAVTPDPPAPKRGRKSRPPSQG